MDSSTELSIKQACADLIARYSHLADTRDHAAFAELFAPDGVWRRAGGKMRGRRQIHDFMDARPAQALTRHVTGSVVVEVQDADHASALSYTTVYRDPAHGGKPGPAPLSGPEMVVEYRDTFTRVDGRWLIRSRDTTVVFSDKA